MKERNVFYVDFFSWSILDNNESFNLFIYISLTLLFVTNHFPKMSPWRRRRINRDYETYFVRQEVTTIELTEEGISINSDNYRELKKWQDYTKFIEDKMMFLIYHSKEGYKVIPKRVFDTEEKLNQFRSFLTQKIRPI